MDLLNKLETSISLIEISKELGLNINTVKRWKVNKKIPNLDRRDFFLPNFSDEVEKNWNVLPKF